MTAYAVFAVPKYTAEGALQVSSQSGAMNPLLELAGAGAQGEVQTEIEIIRRPEFVLRVLKSLRLNVIDPDQPSIVTANLAVAVGGASPVRDELRQIRAAAARVDVREGVYATVTLTVEVTLDRKIVVTVGDSEDL